MGYGARQGRAQALHDPLYARALYLRSGPAGEDVLLVECDVCLLLPVQALEVRHEIARRTGIAVERILMGCIHTHSGPDTGLFERLSGQSASAREAGILEAAALAGCQAAAAPLPARLGVGHARVRIGRNRSRADGPVDPDVLVLRVDSAGPQTHACLAILYVYGCHPTVLGHDNLHYSADWPWAAGLALREAFPGVNPIFALGAHADIDPRTRGLQDLAIADQSRGADFRTLEALGREVGRAVVEAARGLELEARCPVAAASTRVRVATHADSPAERRAALQALGLPEDAKLGTGEIYRLEQERTAHLPLAERRERIACVRRYLRGHTAARVAGGACPEVEVQVLRLGPVLLLALPAEPSVEVGLDWKARCGSAHAAVLGIANGWLRYLPHTHSYEVPLAHQHYEVLQAVLVPEAAEQLLQAGARLAQELDARLATQGAA